MDLKCFVSPPQSKTGPESHPRLCLGVWSVPGSSCELQPGVCLVPAAPDAPPQVTLAPGAAGDGVTQQEVAPAGYLLKSMSIPLGKQVTLVEEGPGDCSNRGSLHVVYLFSGFVMQCNVKV